MGDEEKKQETGEGGTATSTEEKKEENKTFTQEQVNEIVQSRLSKDRESNFKKLGVKDEEELNEILNKGRNYDSLKQSETELIEKNGKLTQKVLFNTHKISAEREDDVETYFKGKGLEFNDENLKNAIETHPEWCGKQVQVGVGKTEQEQPKESEDEILKKLFGIKNVVH